MTDIAKGILGGGWSLVAGWIVPTALNMLVFTFLVLPYASSVPLTDRLATSSAANQSLVLLGAAAVLGLALNALQVPLFRLLEGYLGWPGWAFVEGRRRQLDKRARLRGRLDALRLATADPPGAADEAALSALRSDPATARRLDRDLRRTAGQRAVLRERLRRYPLDDDQVLPTALGNAIRRAEEYGYSRYRLDSQVFWHELDAVASEAARRQVDTARVGLDFFVCLLYGHLLVAASAIAVLVAARPSAPILAVVAAVLVALTPLWYRLAITTTDGYAAAVRALVNLGRVPLATALGLRLPPTIKDEREMWSLASRLVRLSYHEKAADLDRFRDRDRSGSGS
jgi:hypothetical protein